MRARGLTLCTLGLIAFGCAASTFSSTSPRSSKSSAPIPLKSAPVAASADRRTPLDLTTFRPLLAEEDHRAARQKAEEGDLEGAALLVSPKIPVESERQAALAFLAGRLHEQAGEFSRAKDSFAQATRVDWPLRFDAALRAAEATLVLDLPSEAAIWLEEAKILSGEPRHARAQARLLLKNGDRGGAAKNFLRAFEGESRLADLFDLVEALLGPGPGSRELSGEERELAGRVGGALRLARARLGKDGAETRAIEGHLARLPKAPVPAGERLVEVATLVARGSGEEALALADLALADLADEPEFGPERCEANHLKAKALSLVRRWGEACDWILPATTRCRSDPDVHARFLFNAGKYAAADGRDAAAVKLYAELERDYPKNSLADDARLRAARSYRDMGAIARYTDLLMKMPEDYPDGDMTSEGVLEFALYQAQRGDWGAAALILERGANLVRGKDAARGTEFAGAERYFLARARAGTNDVDAALREYESIVLEVPLSYYMLHAFSRLFAADEVRARKALAEGIAHARSSPFSFPARPEYDTPAFRRGLELLRAGDISEGRRVLSTLGLHEGAEDSLVWGIALLYDRAGDAHSAHAIARGRLTDWFGHYPEGPWRTPWEIGFPRPYYGAVTRESKATQVPEALIYGVMREESTFDPLAQSPARAYGLMQVIEPTARMVGKSAGLPHSPAALLKPEVNIALGSRVLAELMKRFDGRLGLAIPGYNAGPGRPARWLRERPEVDFDIWVETIPIRETRRYTKRVLASHAAYDFLYAGAGSVEALLLPRTLSR